MELTEKFSLFERTYLSISHIVAAAHFARIGAALEADESKIFIGSGNSQKHCCISIRPLLTLPSLSSPTSFKLPIISL